MISNYLYIFYFQVSIQRQLEFDDPQRCKKLDLSFGFSSVSILLLLQVFVLDT